MGGRTGNNHWSEERWNNLCKQLCADFGPASAAKIIETIVYTIGGERITIPSLQALQHRERDRRICNTSMVMLRKPRCDSPSPRQRCGVSL